MNNPCIRSTRAGLLALALGMPPLHADLVGQWQGADFVDGGDWTSSAATGNIVATTVGSPASVTEGYPAGAGAVDLFGGSYFVVPADNNPVAGATAMSVVVVFHPLSPGATGENFHQGSGLVGMEIGGVTEDWGVGWNNNRIGAASAQTGVLELSIFSDPLPVEELKVAMYTWSGGVQRIYVNGEIVRSQDIGAVAPRRAADLAIGAMTSDGGNPFNGEIAEVRLYDSDESANAATIASELIDAYAPGVLLESATLNPAGGTFVLVDSAGAEVDAAGTFALSLNGGAVPNEDVQVSKNGGRTTVTFAAAIEHGQVSYDYELGVPLVGGGTADYADFLFSHRLPVALPGTEGSVGSWEILEIQTGDAPLIANVGDIAGAVGAVLANPATAEASAPVFNHADPDTNGVTATGEFNNDFPILSDDTGDENFIVVGKTKVNIATPGEVHTFSVRGDDGFAMRVTGPGGGRFIATGGQGLIDEADAQTLYRDGGTGDSNSRGSYRFDAAGEYEIHYLGWDGGGGGYYELCWAPGVYTETRDTNLWRLVGDDSDPSIPPIRDRFIADPPGPAAAEGSFGVRTYLASTGVTNLDEASNFLATTTRAPDDGLGTTIDSQLQVLNHRDPNDGASYTFPDPQPIPGDSPAINENNVVTVAKGRISVPAAGPYTFLTTTDDGVVLRLKGVDGAPDPAFRRVTSPDAGPRFQMSHPNEVFFYGAGIPIRAIVDLEAGSYDIEFITVENGGGFAYELGAAAGEWPHATTPPGGFQLIGAPAQTVLLPAVAEPGWTVESSIPGLIDYTNTILGAEGRITYTAGLATDDPVWANLGLDPANRETIWPQLDFNDPEDGPQGSFTPTSPWPLDTPNADNDYAIRATGNIVITQAGFYHLGFQGDDGGYMFIYGDGGNADPVIDSIVYTNHLNEAVIGTAPGSSVNNAIRVEVGTGNSRTIVRVPLEPGEYRIQTLVWEGGGGSFWEVMGASEAVGFNLPLLSTAGGTVMTDAGLSLVSQPVVTPGEPGFQLTDVMVTGNPPTTVSFNIASEDGAGYVVEASVDLQTWIEVESNVIGTGASTPVTVTLGDFVELDGEPKVFFRVQTNP